MSIFERVNWKFVGLLGVGLLAFWFFYGMTVGGTEETITITVIEKEITKDSRFVTAMVVTDGEETIEVFEVANSITFGSLSSAELYGSIEVGHTYEVRVVGVRNGLMNTYRNILEIHG